VDPLTVSERGVAHLIESGGVATIAELADAAGISERTFHRLFATKGDVIRPMFREGSRTMARTLAERPAGESVRAAFVAAWAAVAGGPYAERTSRLMPIVLASPGYSAVWEQVTREGDADLAEAIAERLKIAPSAARPIAVALLSQVTLAITRSVDGGGDSVELLDSQLHSLATFLDAH
jgi:AcrR family transcriptional regulator